MDYPLCVDRGPLPFEVLKTNFPAKNPPLHIKLLITGKDIVRRESNPVTIPDLECQK